MENSNFIKTDKDVIINEKYIRWIKKLNERLEICCKMEGCVPGMDTHTVTKLKNPKSYEKLNNLFESD